MTEIFMEGLERDRKAGEDDAFHGDRRKTTRRKTQEERKKARSASHDSRFTIYNSPVGKTQDCKTQDTREEEEGEKRLPRFTIYNLQFTCLKDRDRGAWFSNLFPMC
jgi:hypothetical protein